MIYPFLKRVLPALVLIAPLWAQAESSLPTKSCRLSNFPQEVQCGKISRALDPAKPDGKKIDIHYVVLPSQDRNKLSDAVFLLAGGPGQSAIALSDTGESLLGKLNRRRDLVFVDQRGTGSSAPLNCPKLDNSDKMIDRNAMIAAVQSCMQALQKLPYGDLQFFSTSIAVQDLEAVRVAQKYSAINLVGVSYGTRVGLEYLRQFPLAVRRLVIDAVVPPDLRILGTDAKQALDGLFADCLKQVKCHAAYPDLAKTWQNLLNNTPRQVSFTQPRLGNEMTDLVTREDIINMVRNALYVPNMLAMLPYALTQAEQGKFAPLLTMSGVFNSKSPTALAGGMHYSVWCSEAYAVGQPAPVAPADEFTHVATEMYGKICANWPRATIPKEFFSIPPSNAPVLLLSGGIDPVTPTRNGDMVAKALGAKARHISIANAGHGVLSHGCVREVMTSFIAAKDDAEALKVDAQCVRQIPRPSTWIPPKTIN
ncbi:MAG: alpha/beta hydrolase [Undibacterium sp.]|nr:alpha/beta hydrolase [Undibacterium sp.]